MTAYQVTLRPEAVEDLQALPKNLQRRIVRALETRLGGAPHQYGERLLQSLLGLWRVRVEDYRIVYEITDNKVTVWAVLHRKHVYTEVKRRWFRS